MIRFEPANKKTILRQEHHTLRETCRQWNHSIILEKKRHQMDDTL